MRRQQTRARVARRLALGLLLAGGGCERDTKPDTHAGSAPERALASSLDLGAVRASVSDGIELAARDPAIAQGLGLAARLEDPALQLTIDRLLVWVGEDPQVTAAADQFFASLQASPAIRAALVDYAREHPQLELAALSEGFVQHVKAQLTRPELATLLERSLRAHLRAANPELALAFVSEAEVASILALRVTSILEDPGFEPKLRERLGSDPAAVQARLERRLADPARAGRLLLSLQPVLASEAGLGVFVQILEQDCSVELIAAALARAMADEQVRARCEQLFALALAPKFDEAAFMRALEGLLGEAAVTREAAALLSALAREPTVHFPLQRLCLRFTKQPEFEAKLLAALN